MALNRTRRYDDIISGEKWEVLEELASCSFEIEENLTFASDEVINVLLEQRAGIIGRLPNFWLTALANHPNLKRLFTGADDDCLFYLERIDVEELSSRDDGGGARIHFLFDENPYFENSVLTRSISEKGTPIATWDEVDRKQEGNCGAFLKWFVGGSPFEQDQDTFIECIRYSLWVYALKYYLLPNLRVIRLSRQTFKLFEYARALLNNADNEVGEEWTRAETFTEMVGGSRFMYDYKSEECER